MGFFSDIIKGIKDFFVGEEPEHIEPPPTQYRRKIVKSVYYFEGFTAHKSIRKFVYAMTFENNELDRSEELIEAVEDEFGDLEDISEDAPRMTDIEQLTEFHQKDGIRISEYGYSDSSLTSNPPFKWDIIETGEEK